LKAVTKRDVLRGRRLIAGGWRDLLRAGSFVARTETTLPALSDL
jgi:hypothetical protein